MQNTNFFFNHCITLEAHQECYDKMYKLRLTCENFNFQSIPVIGLSCPFQVHETVLAHEPAPSPNQRKTDAFERKFMVKLNSPH